MNAVPKPIQNKRFVQDLLAGFVLAFCPVLALFAQNELPFGLRKATNIPVIAFNSSDTLRNAWCGGFNAPQFFEIDLDNDEDKDLVVFDRSGNKLLTFKYNHLNNKYDYYPEWESAFPKCSNWIILKDFNQDGAIDLFSSAGNGIKVYKNLSPQGQTPDFEPLTDLLLSDYGNSSFNLYVSPVDIPAIFDMDDDGDLDIVTFFILGTCVEYHKNLSVEELGNADSLLFRLEDSNWGIFTESLNDNSVNLNDSCGRIAGSRHSGSSLLMHDFDHDNDPDLFLGDVSYREMLVLVNEPLNNRDRIIEYPSGYPDYSDLELDVFPAAFVIQPEVNEPPMLVLSPNTDNQSTNQGRIAKAFPTVSDAFDFTGMQQGFLTHEAIDFGTSAYPCLADFDLDGDEDLMVGTFGKFIPSGIPLQDGVYQSSLALLRNTGNNTAPIFKIENNDAGNLFSEGFRHLAPCAGDLNGDDFPDLLVGTFNSGILYLVQAPSSGQFILSDTLPLNDLPTFPVPALQDLNNDNQPDLIIGGRPGFIQYYLNVGNSLFPQFNPNPIFIEGVETIQEGISNFGYSSPAFYNINGDLLLFSGSESGRLHCWELETTNNLVNATLVDSNYVFINDGERTAPCFGSVGQADYPIMIQGNKRGGLNLYRGEAAVAINKSKHENKLRIFPNPAHNYLEFHLPGNTSCELIIRDLTGRIIHKGLISGENEKIALSGCSPGLYLIVCKFPDGKTLQSKFLKM
jgi:hypothetical protein